MTTAENRALPRRASAIFLLVTVFVSVAVCAFAASPTTELTIRKLAPDETTVLEQITVDYLWLSDPENIAVIGDGVTKYYHQGPVFVNDSDPQTQEMLRWNREEDTNIKEMGALRGNNVRDLCELVGGMTEGDRLRVKAADGLSRTFAYKNVYLYSVKEGPMVICWERNGDHPGSEFRDGMRLVWFADNSTNPMGQHVFGNWDWHEAAEPQHWYFFHSADQKYPTTTGLSIQSVSELTILVADTAEPEPAATEKPKTAAPKAEFEASARKGEAPLEVRFSDKSSGNPDSWAWDFDGDGEVDSEEENPVFVYEKPGEYRVSLVVKNEGGSDVALKPGFITVTEPESVEAATEKEEEKEEERSESAVPDEKPEPDAQEPQRTPIASYAIGVAAGVIVALLLKALLRK